MMFTIILVDHARNGGASIVGSSEDPAEAVRLATSASESHATVQVRDTKTGAVYDVRDFARLNKVAA